MVRMRTKKLIDLSLSKSIEKDIIPIPNDGLPLFERFFTCTNLKGLKIKVWLAIVTPEEKNNSKKRKGMESYRNVSINNPIAPWIMDEGFSEAFSQQVARLLIQKFKHKKVSETAIKTTIKTLEALLESLSKKHIYQKININIGNITAEDFIDFRESIQEKAWTKKNKLGRFNSIKKLFSHKSVTNCIHIESIKGGFKGTKSCQPTRDLTSPLFVNSTYSDSVMFQLLCYFIYDFERHIGYLKEYERFTEDDILNESKGDIIRHGVKSKHWRGGSEHRDLLMTWLSDEKFYPIIVKHEILWQKSYGLSFYNKKVAYKSDKHTESYLPLVQKYNTWVNESYSIPSRLIRTKGKRIFRANIPAIHCKELLAKKSQGSTASTIKNRTGYCLANLIMMATGLNREVVLSWESRVNEKSILDINDNLFKEKDFQSSPQALIKGIKKRTGRMLTEKEISTVIPKSTPLYRMLKEYEKHLKSNFDGKFFEFTASFKDEWGFNTQNKTDLFSLMYPVRLDCGLLLQTLDTRKFRKVFGKFKLFSLMDGVKSPLELAEKIQDSFKHGDLDTTLSSYLLKENDSRSAIDLGIVSITSTKINELSFAGQVDISGNKKSYKEVFLCECEDPFSPTHGISIAKECMKYDLCLGCQRSIINAVHLPYICLRIMQYEELRKTTHKWNDFFEDRWMIAYDALKQYKENDKLNGERLESEAWSLAKTKAISLPPILMTETN